jgi:hypothetical protein
MSNRETHTREVLERVEARFAELISMGAFTPEKQQEIADYIETIRARGSVRTGNAFVLADYLYDCKYWIFLGERNPNEGRYFIITPFPTQEVRHYAVPELYLGR